MQSASLCDEAVAGLDIVFFVFPIYLNVVFCERVDVPDADVAFHPADEFFVGRGEDAEPQSRYAIRLRDALDDDEVGMGCEQVVVDE